MKYNLSYKECNEFIKTDYKALTNNPKFSNQ